MESYFAHGSINIQQPKDWRRRLQSINSLLLTGDYHDAIQVRFKSPSIQIQDWLTHEQAHRMQTPRTTTLSRAQNASLPVPAHRMEKQEPPLSLEPGAPIFKSQPTKRPKNQKQNKITGQCEGPHSKRKRLKRHFERQLKRPKTRPNHSKNRDQSAETAT